MASIKRYLIISWTLLLLAGQLKSTAGTLRKLWEVDLRKSVRSLSADSTVGYPVYAVRFSPDGQQLAVAVDQYESGDLIFSRLIVVPVFRPEARREYRIKSPVFSYFGWTPDGQIIYSDGEVIHLSTEKTCDLPWRTIFFADNNAMSRATSDINSLVSHFTFSDADCQVQGNWEAPESWDFESVSLGRGLVAYTHLLKEPVIVAGKPILQLFETVIVDPRTRRVLHRYPPDGPHGDFADNGKAICGGSDADYLPRAPVICWDVDTGVKINEAPGVNGGDPIETASHASRAVVSDLKRERDLFGEYGAVLKRRVVWDFRSNQVLASWRPETQTWEALHHPEQKMKDEFEVDISPDGEYVAEGGNGVIRLYKIEP